MTTQDAVDRWRAFARSTQVTWRGTTRSWAEHLTQTQRGYTDEEELVQPIVFPRFARDLLDFEVGVTLAAEQTGTSGRPDFTPADAVTHPFVFETKGTVERLALAGFEEQIGRYLRESRRRIRQVVLTNLAAIKVFELSDDPEHSVRVAYEVNLLGLLEGTAEAAARLPTADALRRFLSDFRRRELTPEQKLEQARQAPEWVPAFENTDATWLSERLDRVVLALADDVHDQVVAGALEDDTVVAPGLRREVLEELHELEWRIAERESTPPSRTLESYRTARASTPAGKALRQFEAHVAYFTATRLLLVRVFEDLGLLPPVLYDGGLDQWLQRLNDAIPDVIDQAFREARRTYPSLFDQRNTYTWYEPRGGALVDVIYELANTYLGNVQSDVLGAVYERLLERVDRKLLGQYYTPRDVIRLIWDLVSIDPLAQAAESEQRPFRLLDIATGSGGFLVEPARRLRARLDEQRAAGAAVDTGQWLRAVARGLTGVERQRFPAYLAELNLLIQLALAGTNGGPAIPAVGVICHDTLDTHNPETGRIPTRLPYRDQNRVDRFEELCDPAATGTWFDAAVGNPPYVGEKIGAAMIDAIRRRAPYWERFYAVHLDYLYWFIVLGVSKLRRGGRFGFITSEYWLRAAAAAPMRRFLAQHCYIERLILFRDVRLFPDAPGHHSLVVVGERRVDAGDRPVDAPAASTERPIVHMLGAPAARDARARQDAFDRIRRDFRGNSTTVRGWQAAVAPGPLLDRSWGDVILSPDLLRQRARIAQLGPAVLDASSISEGIITAADRVRNTDLPRLPQQVAEQVQDPARRGIFILRAAEVADLGSLNDAETDAIKPTINTRHVLPYACVPPADVDRMLYVPSPPGAAADPDGATRAFAERMPALYQHLRRFEPLLRAKVESYNAQRPWWTIHNPRPTIAAAEGDHQRWAGYACISRWGPGGHLKVGLAPRHHAPQSSLHALMPADTNVHAAYVVALFNSTIVQALADAVAPGQMRSEEVIAFGLPHLDDDSVQLITARGFELADLVHELVTLHEPRWPELRDDLARDLSLSQPLSGAWSPAPGAPTTHGRAADVHWLRIERPRAMRQPLRSVTTEIDLMGEHILATGDTTTMRLTLVEPTDALRDALIDLLEGVRARGEALAAIPELEVPTSAEALIAARTQDREELEAFVQRYQDARRAIDDRLGEVVR